MDYCSTCRRTLNGVFVCPGCGAYAPDIAPAGSHRHHTPSTVAVMAEISHTREFDAFPGFPDANFADPAFADPSFNDSAYAGPDVDAPVGPATSSATGRAARRRRLADWKKQRRRAVVASTVALVGGGLTLAFMPSSRPSASQAQASTLPDPLTAPSTSSAGSVDTGTDSDTEKPRTGDPRHSESGNGSSKAPKGDNSPGSATAITPVDAPAKRKTPPPSTPDESNPTADTQPEAQPEAPAANPDTPPVAEEPTQQPNEPTAPAPAPPPPSADPPKESNPGLCVLVLCVDLDGRN
ncbi:SCO2400 family protein [Streptomyces niveus]